MKKILLTLFISSHLFCHDSYMGPNPDVFNKKLVKTAKIIGTGVLGCFTFGSLMAVGNEYIKISDNVSFRNICGFTSAIAMTAGLGYATHYLGKDLFKDISDYLKKKKLMKQDSDNQLLESQ